MKKIVLLLGICLIVTPLFAEPRRVIYRPDDSVVILLPAKDKNPQEAFEEITNSIPELIGLPFDDIDNSELPKSDRKYWIKKEGGGVKVDQAKKAQAEQEKQAKKAKKDSGKQKLKDLGLTDEELAELLGE